MCCDIAPMNGYPQLMLRVAVLSLQKLVIMFCYGYIVSMSSREGAHAFVNCLSVNFCQQLEYFGWEG